MNRALEQILTCPVCLERFTPAGGQRCPKLLPMCGHCFCLSCLNHLSVRALGKQILAATEILRLPPHTSMAWSCPECRQRIQFGHEHTYSNPAALPNCLQTLRLLDAVQTCESRATPREILERCARTHAHASARETVEAEVEDGTTILHIV